MTIDSLILMLICAICSIVAGSILFSGSNEDRRNYMHYEKCNHTDCDTCLDKGQCPEGKRRCGEDEV